MEWSMDDFVSAATKFREWVDTFDPATCTPQDVGGVLELLLDRAPRPHLADSERPRFRIYGPNPTWQAVQRKAALLPFNGYRAQLLPNDDAVADTQCALSYDLSDLNEHLEYLEHGELRQEFENYLDYVSWGYTNLRIRGAIGALRSPAWVPDPFARRSIKGRTLRFVSWRTNSWTHASEDAEDVRGAGTLCGGRLAFHKHTQQQWSCYACEQCRCIVDGVEYVHPFADVLLEVENLLTRLDTDREARDR